jgi:hypothetical protein
MTLENHDPALHVMMFSPLGPNATDPDRALAKTWEAASQLGINDPATAFDQPIAVVVWLRFKPGRRRQRVGGLVQCLARSRRQGLSGRHIRSRVRVHRWHR